MNIKKIAKCGTLESNDIYIVISPYDNGIKIELESNVKKQFGEHIEKIITEKLLSLGVKNALVQAQDKGALDYTILSRIETAVLRSQNN